MHLIRVATIILLTAGLSSSAFAKGRGVREKVDWKDVPAAVQTTIQENAAGGTIRSIEKRTRRGEVTYTADVKGTDGKRSEIEVSSSGKLLEIEEVDPSEADDESD